MSTIQKQIVAEQYAVNCIFCVGQGKIASVHGSMDTCFCCHGTGKNYLNKYDIEHRLKEMLKERPLAAHQNKSWRRWDRVIDWTKLIEVESISPDGAITVRVPVPLNFIMLNVTFEEPEG